MSLIAELKRRNVFRVGVAYAIVAWLLVEVASVIPTPGGRYTKVGPTLHRRDPFMPIQLAKSIPWQSHSERNQQQDVSYSRRSSGRGP